MTPDLADDRALYAEMKAKHPEMTTDDFAKVLTGSVESVKKREALHEAGHVVMDFALGLEVEFVNLPDPRKGDWSEPVTRFRWPIFASPPPEFGALCSVAGAAAERVGSHRKKASPSHTDRALFVRMMETSSREIREGWVLMAVDFFREPPAARYLEKVSGFLYSRWGARTSGEAVWAACPRPRDFDRLAGKLWRRLLKGNR